MVARSKLTKNDVEPEVVPTDAKSGASAGAKPEVAAGTKQEEAAKASSETKKKPTSTRRTTARAKKATAAEEAKTSEAQAPKATSEKAAPAKRAAAKTAPAKAEPAKATAAKSKASKSEPTKAQAATTEVKEASSASDDALSVEAKQAEPAKAAAKKAPAKTAAAKKTAPAKKTTSKKTTTRKATAKKAAGQKAEAEEPKPLSAKDDAAKASEPKVEPKPEPAPAPADASTLTPAPVVELEPAPAPVAESTPEPEPAVEPAPEPEPVPTPELAPEPEPVSEYAGVGGVLIAAAECAPLVKIGGLADVVGALPKYLKKLGIDARVIMPFHRQIKERYFNQTQHMCDFQASLGWRSQYVGLERLELDGTVFYFIDNEFYFGGPVYCGGEFEGEQYAFFTRAVMDCIPQLDFDVRILHCNDWHTAMMPLLVKTQYQGGMQAGLRTVQTIHNLHFQGQFSHEFDRDLLRVDDSLATPQFIEHYGCDNMLKAGIVFADKVSTVSPTYSQEICGPELGESLEGVLRSRGGDLWGILNGIDVDIWNPSTDKALPATYSAANLEGKKQDRDALLYELGLAPAGDNTPVIAMVGRLTPQKGIDLVRWALDEIMAEDVRVIILGSGDAEYENSLRDAENRYKGRLCSYIGYNGELSHRIYAGADLFLMPSLFEPCGISQMIAMRYGTLPIVRETGGLKDTVIPYNQYTGEGTGFSFAHYDVAEMLGCIRYAINVWRDPNARKQLIEQAMNSDFSFDRCARAYAELYRTL